MIHTTKWAGLEIDLELIDTPAYHSPKSTEDCEQGVREAELLAVRYDDVPEFLAEYFEYFDKPDVLEKRWLAEFPVQGADVHPKVRAYVEEYLDAILDDVWEEVAA